MALAIVYESISLFTLPSCAFLFCVFTYTRGIVCVCVCVCVCVRACVHPSTVFLGNRGNSEREMWTYYQGGMNGKIRFWSGEGRVSW